MQALETEVAVSFSPLGPRYTLEEFWQLPDPSDRAHYELIGGSLFMVPPAAAPHDDLDARLVKSLMRLLFMQNISGDVFHPRAAIYRNAEVSTYLDPVTVTIEVRNAIMRGDRLVWEIRRYAAGESAESKVLAGWHVSVDELFAGLV